eukprot:scaffold51065_cov45-Phaeocystis_antarctica.AAC.2
MNTDSGRVAIVMPPRMSTMAAMDDAQANTLTHNPSPHPNPDPNPDPNPNPNPHPHPNPNPDPNPNPNPNPDPNPDPHQAKEVWNQTWTCSNALDRDWIRKRLKEDTHHDCKLMFIELELTDPELIRHP